MSRRSLVVLLALLAALLAAGASAAGLFWPGGGEPWEFATPRGGTARIMGQGLYRFDTVFFGAGYRGYDAVVLGMAVPATLASARAFRQGSLRAGLVLAGALAFLLYTYASLGMGAAFNPLFLVYVAAFSASLWGLVLLLLEIGTTPFRGDLPRRAAGLYMVVAGAGVTAIWLLFLLPDMIAGRVPPLLDSYATFVTYALDLGIIAPATLASGVLILRGRPEGYLMAVPLIGVILFLAPGIAAATWFQARAGIAFSTGEIAGPIVSFVVLGALGAWVLWAILRRVAG